MIRRLVWRLCWAAMSCWGAAVHAADQPLTVLLMHGAVTTRPMGQDSMFVKRATLPDNKLQDRLAAEKIVSGAESFSTQMTWDFLKQFNVVVMLDFPIVEKHEALKAAIADQEQLLARFVAEGGGIAGTITQAKLPIDLPVTIAGLTAAGLLASCTAGRTICSSP
jgi:hypothetical protein